MNGAQDCSNVAGCNKKNCGECVSMYWGANPSTCVPGCINEQLGTIKELEHENEQLREEGGRAGAGIGAGAGAGR
jgi:hypothetical protein